MNLKLSKNTKMSKQNSKMKRSEGLVQRKHFTSDHNDSERHEVSEEGDDSKDAKLTLTENIFLLGLKDKEGYISFWNDCISTGLRGCILIDLCLRGKIELEKAGVKCKNLLLRKVVVKNETSVGDALLDEAFKYIKTSSELHTVPEWIDYFSGDSWNPLKLKYRLKNVRNRIAKSLVEKGTLTTGAQNFILFNIKTHPLLQNITKLRLINSVQNALLKKWSNDCLRMDKRLVALVFMAHACDVLEDTFANLNSEDYELVKTRMNILLHLDFEIQAYRSECDALLWAVFYSLYKLELL